jgi:lysozyme
MPKINAAGLAIVKKYEGCSLNAYQDPVGIWTIGYGHTPSSAGAIVTQAQADLLLADDLARFEVGVNDLVVRNLTPNQFSALVSFAFNVGLGALADSTLLALVNAGNFREAALQFVHWVYAGGSVFPGLVARRGAEGHLFSAA